MCIRGLDKPDLFWPFDFKSEPIFATAQDYPTNITHFKSGQKWSNKNPLVTYTKVSLNRWYTLPYFYDNILEDLWSFTTKTVKVKVVLNFLPVVNSNRRKWKQLTKLFFENIEDERRTRKPSCLTIKWGKIVWIRLPENRVTKFWSYLNFKLLFQKLFAKVTY